MKKIDMHIHSTVSDGSCTVEEIIAMAREKELDGIVITDHDTTAQRHYIARAVSAGAAGAAGAGESPGGARGAGQGSKVAGQGSRVAGQGSRDAGQGDRGAGQEDRGGLWVSWGVELSAWDYESKTRAHILGYDIQKPEVVDQAALPILEARHANSLKQIEILRSHGCAIDPDRVKRADGKYIYKQHIMDYLLEQGEVTELFGEFYYRTFKNGGICAFDISYMKAREAVDVIVQAGGLPVLAHSGQQQNFFLVPDLVGAGLRGLELNHHSHSAADRERIRELAGQYRLCLTGGSDFHGRYEPQVCQIGEEVAYMP